MAEGLKGTWWKKEKLITVEMDLAKARSVSRTLSVRKSSGHAKVKDTEDL